MKYNDQLHYDQIMNQQEGGAASCKWIVEGGKLCVCGGELQESGAVGAEVLEGVSELMASYWYKDLCAGLLVLYKMLSYIWNQDLILHRLKVS